MALLGGTINSTLPHRQQHYRADSQWTPITSVSGLMPGELLRERLSDQELGREVLGSGSSHADQLLSEMIQPTIRRNHNRYRSIDYSP